MEKDSNQPHEFVSRRTRSREATDWSVINSLVLVNEVAAVEGDCQKTLSSFQKWRIISENCTAQDVVRNVNQCRRKWDSLLAEYKQINQWELQSGVGSYWSIGSERRKELGLPESFDNDVFTAIDKFVRTQEDQLDTDESDPESDPEIQVGLLDFDRESGSKGRKRLLRPQIGCQRQKFKRRSLEYRPGQSLAEKMLKETNAVEKPRRNSMDGTQHVSLTKEEPRSSCVEVEPQKEKVKVEHSNEAATTVDKKEDIMVANLRANAEMIHSIVNGNLPGSGDDGSSNMDDSQSVFIRCQGDKLISCLRDIANTLSDLSDLVQESE